MNFSEPYFFSSCHSPVLPTVSNALLIDKYMVVGPAQCTFLVVVGDKISYPRCSGYLSHIVSPELPLVLWVDSLLRRILTKIWKEERFLYSSHSLFDHLDGYSACIACGTEPISQALVISWCSLLNRLSPPCFHTSAGIPRSFRLL